MAKQEVKKQALEDLSRLYLQSVQLESKRARAVVSARLAGATWLEVGDTQLLSKQTARRKYAALVEELHPDYEYPLPDTTTGP